MLLLRLREGCSSSICRRLVLVCGPMKCDHEKSQWRISTLKSIAVISFALALRNSALIIDMKRFEFKITALNGFRDRLLHFLS